ncbi:Hypothetical predicted protein [Octopus vulgaris]|uniref:Uncharacterized protein n=1 Tax=Octopus vulgaris TaxID=6645 RepID=A0AA36AHU2_OCTVU|nr:Hypothetical predicted protein [Octopus vulgaris]
MKHCVMRTFYEVNKTGEKEGVKKRAREMGDRKKVGETGDKIDPNYLRMEIYRRRISVIFMTELSLIHSTIHKAEIRTDSTLASDMKIFERDIDDECENVCDEA